MALARASSQARICPERPVAVGTAIACGVPIFVSGHWPSFDTPAFRHFCIIPSIRLSAKRCPTDRSRLPAAGAGFRVYYRRRTRSISINPMRRSSKSTRQLNR